MRWSSARPSPRRWPGSTATRATWSRPTSWAPTTASSWPAATAPSRVPVHEPGLSVRARSTARASARPRPASSSPPTRTLPGISPAGVSESFPLDGARTLYGATKLAAELLIEEYRAGSGSGRDRPLRGDRRPLADGQGRPGRVHLLAASAPLRRRAPLHRIRRRRKAGARPPARGRPGRPHRGPAAAPGALGRRDRERGRGPDSSLSLLETTELCRRADRQRGSPVQPSGRDAAGRRARSTSPTARACGGLPTGARDAAPRRCSRTRSPGWPTTSAPSRPRWPSGTRPLAQGADAHALLRLQARRSTAVVERVAPRPEHGRARRGSGPFRVRGRSTRLQSAARPPSRSPPPAPHEQAGGRDPLSSTLGTASLRVCRGSGLNARQPARPRCHAALGPQSAAALVPNDAPIGAARGPMSWTSISSVSVFTRAGSGAVTSWAGE